MVLLCKNLHLSSVLANLQLAQQPFNECFILFYDYTLPQVRSHSLRHVGFFSLHCVVKGQKRSSDRRVVYISVQVLS